MLLAKKRARYEKRVLSEVPIEAIFGISGQLGFMDGVPKLVGCLSDEQLIELVHGWGKGTGGGTWKDVVDG